MVTERNVRQLRVLHLVSSGGVSGPMQQSLFMPLLTRMPRQRVKAQVVALAPGFTAGAVLRQHDTPVHDVALSRHRFSWGAIRGLSDIARQFRPDILQAWGHTAQLAALLLRARCDWQPKVVWNIADTNALAKDAAARDRYKLKLTARFSARPDRIVYSSQAAAAQHRRYGYPDDGHRVIEPGVDPMRCKPDPAARRRVREQLELGSDAFVVGMIAPFQAEHDHATLLRGVGELIKTEPKLHLLLAGHGLQKGNGPLMALLGGGALGTRTRLLGDWSDLNTFFNACDVACLSSHSDQLRMTLVMAMLCGVPCVATGMGAQGEVIGRLGIAIEPGSPAAFVRGITRVLRLPPERRSAMVKSARKHALSHFAQVHSLQKYLQLYLELLGHPVPALDSVPVPVPVPVPEPDVVIPEPAEVHAPKVKPLPTVAQPESPHSSEEQVPAAAFEQQRQPVEPAQARVMAAPPAAELPEIESPGVASSGDGDVLDEFEADMANWANRAVARNSPTADHGVVEEMEDLLAPEDLVSLETPVEPGTAGSRGTSEGSLELALAPDDPPTRQASG